MMAKHSVLRRKKKILYVTNKATKKKHEAGLKNHRKKVKLMMFAWLAQYLIDQITCSGRNRLRGVQKAQLFFTYIYIGGEIETQHA